MKTNKISLILMLSLSFSSPLYPNANSYLNNSINILYSSFKNLSQYMPDIFLKLTLENVSLFTATIGTLGIFAYQSYQSYMRSKFLNTIREQDMRQYQDLTSKQILKRIDQIKNDKTINLTTKAEKLGLLYQTAKERRTNPLNDRFFIDSPQ